MTNVADAIVKELVGGGVSEIFGMDSPESFYRAALSAGMSATTIRDERSAVAMADAYARVSGRMAICTAIQGPGATNLVTTLAEANRAASPLIAIVKDTAVSEDGRHPFQELDEAAVLAPVTKATFRVTRANEAVSMTSRALRMALAGRPGPVALVLPGDILDTPAGEDTGDSGLPSPSWPDPEALKRLRDRILGARRPLLVVGELIAKVPGGADSLVAKLRVPVAMTTLGHGGVSDDLPWSLGVVGAYTSGTPRGVGALRYAMEADCVVFIGCHLDSLDTHGWQYPNASAWIGWVAPDDLGPPSHVNVDAFVHSDIAPFLEALKASVSEGRSDDPVVIPQSTPRYDEVTVPLHPGAVAMHVVESASRTGSPVVADASFSSAWGLSLVSSTTKRQALLAPRGMGGLGWSIPAAIGASIASQRKRVLTLTGDGAAGYSVMELDTAVRAEVWICVVVLNNDLLGFQHHWEMREHGSTFSPGLGHIDFAAIAQAIGAQGHRVTDIASLAGLLEETAASPGVHLLDVETDGSVPGPISWFEEETAPVDRRTGEH